MERTMLTTDDTYTTDAPAIDLAAATRAFLDAARRSMSPQTQADYATYERLAAHEETAADKAAAAGRHTYARSARKCADNYRAQAYAMLARILIASVSREIAA
jgi:hypothetical protein